MDMQNPTISVVIPAYHSTKTIAACLDSVVAQTYLPAEIIIVDDASRDDTVACIEQWRKTSSHASICIQLSQNGGPAAARNAGLQAATSEWIAFLDADDAWLPWKLAVQVAVLQEQPAVVMLCGQTLALREKDTVAYTPPKQLPEPQQLTLLQLLSHNPVATSTVLARRDCLLAQEGFDTAFRGPEDYDLWLRLVATGNCLYLPLPLTRYRTTVGSLSMDDRTFLPQVLRVLDKAFGPAGVLAPYQRFRKRAIAEQFASASWMAYHRGDRKRALFLLIRSWLYGPTKLVKEKKDPFQRLKLLIRYVHK